MKVAITGSNGVVGHAIIENIDKAKFEIIAIDLPDHDVTNRDDLTQATAGCDAIIHMAWATERGNFRVDDMDPINVPMIFNAYQAALANKIPRIVMASSNHAQRYDMRDADGKIRASIQPAVPDSEYGAEKIYAEALGRHYALTRGLEVVCLRIGTVTPEDERQPSTPNSPTRYLSHADLGRLVTCCLEAKDIPNNFEIIYAVSNQDVFDWSNSVGYVPVD
jgi:nucleoside-diphosphate-sugar epimerase